MNDCELKGQNYYVVSVFYLEIHSFTFLSNNYDFYCKVFTFYLIVLTLHPITLTFYLLLTMGILFSSSLVFM